MNPSRCAYCGTLAENPVYLSWAVADQTGPESLSGSLPLCVECSQSWCPQPVPGAELCSESDRLAG